VIVLFGVIVPLWVPEIEGYGFEGEPVSKTFNAPEVVNLYSELSAEFPLWSVYAVYNEIITVAW